MKSNKLIFTSIPLAAFLLGLVGMVLSKTTLSGYRSLDQRFIIDDANRVLRTFKEQFLFLESKVGDWGAWDEAYAYLEDRNEHFVNANITDKVIGSMKISFVAYLDENFKILIAKKFNEETGKLEVIDSNSLPFLTSKHTLISKSDKAAFSGLVAFKDDIMIVAATKVARGDGSGQAKGRVVFGRIINASLLKALSEQTLRPISIQKIDTYLPSNSQITIESGFIDIHDTTSFTYLNLTSLDNEPLALLKVEVPRTVYSFGQEKADQLLIIYAIMCIALVAGTFLFLSTKTMRVRFSSLTLANEKLSESESNFRVLVDSIPGFVSWVDKDLRYLGVNKRLAAEHKLEPRDFVGKKIGFLNFKTSPDFQERLNDFIQSSIEFKELDMFFISETNTSKTTVFLQKFDHGKKIVIVVIDITEKWKLEQQIIKTYEKAAQASRLYSIGQMASGIAHEVNNPLMIILGLTRKIQKISQDHKTKESDDLFEKLTATVYRISKIVNGLRAFSRDGSLDPLEPTDICAIVDEASGMCSEKFRNDGIDLRVIHPSSPAMVNGRSVQLGQVLVNLLNNAYDAVSSLETKWVEISVSESASIVRMTITDSGSGIPSDIARKIMDPFFTTKEVGKGTGIGLSISKTILENHKGKIYLDEKCKNTRFVVEVPKDLPASPSIITAA